jgi:hypothetical protein
MQAAQVQGCEDPSSTSGKPEIAWLSMQLTGERVIQCKALLVISVGD